MLDGLFKPRAVAIIGASNNPFSIGHIVIKNLYDHGFKGPIFPINPKASHIRSFKAFKSISDVPDEVDLVNISIAAKHVPAVIDECGNKGVKFAIVHSAGFKEVGEQGIELERRMVETAHRHGMRIFGPNSQGIQNSAEEVSVYANFTFVPMNPGNVSIIAQGGGMGELLKLHLHKVGLGHRMYCSYGNECDLTMPEILDYYGQDEGTRVIMMQIESFKNPAAFLEVASRITPHKPILAIKAGRTRQGAVAVSSHTGTLVDQAAMATAMFNKAGVLEFHDSEQMIKAAVAFSMQDLPPGNRIGCITNTGGPGIQAVDESIDQGLELAVWSDAGKQRLQQTQLPMASTGNPVDVVATGGPDEYFHAVDTLLGEEGTDMVLVFFVTAPFVDLDAIAARLKEATDGAGKPVVVVIETIARWQGLIDKLRAVGLPVYEFAEDGARALGAMARYVRLRDRPTENLADLGEDRATAEKIVRAHEGQDRYLSQADAFALLAAYGVPVPRVRAIRDSCEAATAAGEVGFPCVLKVDAPEVVHKSDEGGVALGLKDQAELDEALKAMGDRFSGKDVSYVLMEHREPGRELIVGATEAPGLGSLVMFGLGGVFVEVMKDVCFAVAPVSAPEAREMMRSIQGYPLLEGARGEAGVDLPGLQEMLVRVSRLAADFESIVEMDLNPIFAYPAGTPPVAVDVRIKVR